MGKVKTFDEFRESKTSEVGSSGEISEDNHCSDDCKGKVSEMFEKLMSEMKEKHGDDSDVTAQSYLSAVESLISSHSGAMKAECEKSMSESNHKDSDSKEDNDKKNKD